MNKENKLVPVLRFPEFKNEGEWEVEPLGNICDYWNGASHEGGVTENGDYNLISLNSIDIDGNLKSEMKRLNYTDNSLRKNDLVMVLSDVAHGNFLGLTDIIPNNRFVLNQRMAGLRLKDYNFGNVSYIRTFINYNQKYFKHKGQGSSQLNLSKSAVTDFPVLLPKPAEQQKIASCLSSLDELISAHTQKLDALKDHKKGLMQKLFPQEGEIVPKLRFKEFENDGEWVKVAINKLVPQNEKYGIVDGPFGSNLKTIHYKTEGIPIITSGYVTDGVFKADKYLYVTEEKFNEEKRSAVKGGDIVMAKIGARCGASAIIPQNHSIGILSGNALKITIDASKYSTNFIWQKLWYLHSSEKFNGITSIGAQPAISMDSLKKFELLVPTKIHEQQKIANFLSSIDDEITAQAQKIEGLKDHKRGLMQGLFPVINE